jgi:DNA anti-recombination protein RmuC
MRKCRSWISSTHSKWPTPTKRAEALAAHAGKLKATIKALADRDYPSQFPNALDYVVLFVPAESLFSAALEGDHDLIIWAANKRIMLATPASLIALLRSVSVSWQQHAQTENAQKIAAAAQEFYARVVTFTEHFDDIRDGLEKANSAYNKAAASFQSRVRPAGRTPRRTGRWAVEGKKLAEAPLIETQPQKAPVKFFGVSKALGLAMALLGFLSSLRGRRAGVAPSHRQSLIRSKTNIARNSRRA